MQYIDLTNKFKFVGLMKTIFRAIKMYFTFILQEIQERIMRIARRKLRKKKTAAAWACSIVRDLILSDHLSWLEA